MPGRLPIPLVLLCALATAWAAPAASAAPSPVIADCNSHGRLTQHYTVAQLHTALATMPADVQEYTDCYDVIDRALLAEVSGTHRTTSTNSSGPSSSSSFLPTPVIVVLVLVVLVGSGFGAVALRRRAKPQRGRQ